MSALDIQEGGGHYKDLPIQPITFIMENKLPYCEANVIKYVCRHKAKNGVEDLRKAKHYIDLLIEKEYLNVDTRGPDKERTAGADWAGTRSDRNV